MRNNDQQDNLTRDNDPKDQQGNKGAAAAAASSPSEQNITDQLPSTSKKLSLFISHLKEKKSNASKAMQASYEELITHLEQINRCELILNDMNDRLVIQAGAHMERIKAHLDEHNLTDNTFNEYYTYVSENFPAISVTGNPKIQSILDLLNFQEALTQLLKEMESDEKGAEILNAKPSDYSDDTLSDELNALSNSSLNFIRGFESLNADTLKQDFNPLLNPGSIMNFIMSHGKIALQLKALKRIKQLDDQHPNNPNDQHPIQKLIDLFEEFNPRKLDQPQDHSNAQSTAEQQIGDFVQSTHTYKHPKDFDTSITDELNNNYKELSTLLNTFQQTPSALQDPKNPNVFKANLLMSKIIEIEYEYREQYGRHTTDFAQSISTLAPELTRNSIVMMLYPLKRHLEWYQEEMLAALPSELQQHKTTLTKHFTNLLTATSLDQITAALLEIEEICIDNKLDLEGDAASEFQSLLGYIDTIIEELGIPHAATLSIDQLPRNHNVRSIWERKDGLKLIIDGHEVNFQVELCQAGARGYYRLTPTPSEEHLDDIELPKIFSWGANDNATLRISFDGEIYNNAGQKLSDSVLPHDDKIRIVHALRDMNQRLKAEVATHSISEPAQNTASLSNEQKAYSAIIDDFRRSAATNGANAFIHIEENGPAQAVNHITLKETIENTEKDLENIATQLLVNSNALTTDSEIEALTNKLRAALFSNDEKNPGLMKELEKFHEIKMEKSSDKHLLLKSNLLKYALYKSGYFQDELLNPVDVTFPWLSGRQSVSTFSDYLLLTLNAQLECIDQPHTLKVRDEIITRTSFDQIVPVTETTHLNSVKLPFTLSFNDDNNQIEATDNNGNTFIVNPYVILKPYETRDGTASYVGISFFDAYSEQTIFITEDLQEIYIKEDEDSRFVKLDSANDDELPEALKVVATKPGLAKALSVKAYQLKYDDTRKEEDSSLRAAAATFLPTDNDDDAQYQQAAYDHEEERNAPQPIAVGSIIFKGQKFDITYKELTTHNESQPLESCTITFTPSSEVEQNFTTVLTERISTVTEQKYRVITFGNTARLTLPKTEYEETLKQIHKVINHQSETSNPASLDKLAPEPPRPVAAQEDPAQILHATTTTDNQTNRAAAQHALETPQHRTQADTAADEAQHASHTQQSTTSNEASSVYFRMCDDVCERPAIDIMVGQTAATVIKYANSYLVDLEGDIITLDNYAKLTSRFGEYVTNKIIRGFQAVNSSIPSHYTPITLQQIILGAKRNAEHDTGGTTINEGQYTIEHFLQHYGLDTKQRITDGNTASTLLKAIEAYYLSQTRNADIPQIQYLNQHKLIQEIFSIKQTSSTQLNAEIVRLNAFEHAAKSFSSLSPEMRDIKIKGLLSSTPYRPQQQNSDSDFDTQAVYQLLSEIAFNNPTLTINPETFQLVQQSILVTDNDDTQYTLTTQGMNESYFNGWIKYSVTNDKSPGNVTIYMNGDGELGVSTGETIKVSDGSNPQQQAIISALGGSKANRNNQQRIALVAHANYLGFIARTEPATEPQPTQQQARQSYPTTPAAEPNKASALPEPPDTSIPDNVGGGAAAAASSPEPLSPYSNKPSAPAENIDTSINRINEMNVPSFKFRTTEELKDLKTGIGTNITAFFNANNFSTTNNPDSPLPECPVSDHKIIATKVQIGAKEHIMATFNMWAPNTPSATSILGNTFRMSLKSTHQNRFEKLAEYIIESFKSGVELLALQEVPLPNGPYYNDFIQALRDYKLKDAQNLQLNIDSLAQTFEQKKGEKTREFGNAILVNTEIFSIQKKGSAIKGVGVECEVTRKSDGTKFNTISFHADQANKEQLEELTKRTGAIDDPSMKDRAVCLGDTNLDCNNHSTTNADLKANCDQTNGVTSEQPTIPFKGLNKTLNTFDAILVPKGMRGLPTAAAVKINQQTELEISDIKTDPANPNNITITLLDESTYSIQLDQQSGLANLPSLNNIKLKLTALLKLTGHFDKLSIDNLKTHCCDIIKIDQYPHHDDLRDQKMIVKQTIKDTVEAIKDNKTATAKEKIDALHKIFEAMQENHPLRQERDSKQNSTGFNWATLFVSRDKYGNTQSYSDAMGYLKSSLLNVLDDFNENYTQEDKKTIASQLKTNVTKILEAHRKHEGITRPKATASLSKAPYKEFCKIAAQVQQTP